jgi:hypothetical protein
MCSFFDITSHRNLLLLCVNDLAVRVCDKEVPNKGTVHLLVTAFRHTGSVCL